MAFALIFIIVLSIILLIGAFLIWKSDLPDHDKIVSIIAILALFSLVSIVNEAKKSSYEEAKYNVAEFERYFYTPPELDTNIEYKIPLLNDFKDIFVSSLDGYDIERPDSYRFSLLYHSERVGKTLSSQEYTKYLQNKRIPTLYVNVKNSDTDIFQFAGNLKLANLHVLNDVIERFNQNSKTPVIIIDHIQNAFQFANSTPCSVCEYFKGVYDNTKVHIIMISNDARVREYFKSSVSYNKRMDYFNYKERMPVDVTEYLQDKINYSIKKNENKFDNDSIKAFINGLGWSFSMIHEYIKKIDQFESVQDFVHKRIAFESQSQIQNDQNLVQFLKCMSKLDQSGANSLIEYGKLKRQCTENSHDSILNGIHSKILVRSGNCYQFRHNLIYNAFKKIEGKEIDLQKEIQNSVHKETIKNDTVVQGSPDVKNDANQNSKNSTETSLK